MGDRGTFTGLVALGLCAGTLSFTAFQSFVGGTTPTRGWAVAEVPSDVEMDVLGEPDGFEMVVAPGFEGLPSEARAAAAVAGQERYADSLLAGSDGSDRDVTGRAVALGTDPVERDLAAAVGTGGVQKLNAAYPPMPVGTPRLRRDSEIHTVPRFHEVQHRLQRGESISQVLATYGVQPPEAARWIRAARKVYNLNKVFEGQRLTLEVDAATRQVVSLQMEIDPETNLVARRTDGDVIAERELVTMDRNLRVVKGRVTTSFYTAAADAGVPDKIIAEVAEVVGWDLNFATDLRPGAGFKVVYEEFERTHGAPPVAGRLLAVQIESRKKVHEGIYFRRPEDGVPGYYTREGQSVGRDFLRYPVAFTRISSHFAAQRFHPVLKRSRPHYGVDFAAPHGTPVRSVADGRVTKAGWAGGFGRLVRVQHDGTFGSGYAHLSKIHPSVQPGSSVKKGQVLGYVGASGLATGAHLHFEMYRNGNQVDPLGKGMPRSRSLNGEALRKFNQLVAKVDTAFENATTAGPSTLMASADIEP